MDNKKRVLMLCGVFMEDFEAIVPFQALQAYGVEVDAVCPGKKAGDVCPTVTSYFYGDQTLTPCAPDWVKPWREISGHNFILNATFDTIDVSSYDGLIIPGARGPEYLATYTSVRDVVRKFYSNEKPIAAICHALLLLTAADPDIVKGRKCTGFPTMRPVALAAGADWVEPSDPTAWVVDDNLITASVPAGHREYIGSFIKAIGGVISEHKKRILMLCGDSMEEYDGIVPFQSLQIAGCHVDAICLNKKEGDVCQTIIQQYEAESNFTDKPGVDFKLTATFDAIDTESYDGLIIPGGKAAEFYALHSKVTSLVKYFMEAGKPIATIGFGQLILAAAHVLKGKRCTAHPCAKVNVVLAKAIWMEPDLITRCYTDGNLVSGAWWKGRIELISQFMALLDIHVSFP